MPFSVVYNGSTYYYVLSLQGDVVAILDSSGVSVAEYTYDAWGRMLSTTGSMSGTLGLHNPLRYRGYVYDRETGLYYLQSRYYNPTICRFISADAYVSTGQGILSYNMFAYCLNNPVSRIDISGTAGISYTEKDLTPWEDMINNNLGIGGSAGGGVGTGVGGGNIGTIGGRGQLRINMLKGGPSPGPSYQAHHGLPWAYKGYFDSAGININDPQYGRWVNSAHQYWSYRYGKVWLDYISRHPIPDADDIIDFFNRINGLK